MSYRGVGCRYRVAIFVGGGHQASVVGVPLIEVVLSKRLNLRQEGGRGECRRAFRRDLIAPPDAVVGKPVCIYEVVGLTITLALENPTAAHGRTDASPTDATGYP